MANINLLPWREERREELKKEFISILVVFAAFAVAIIIAWYSILNIQIESQEGRNSFIQVRISELDKQVKEISELKQQKNQLIARMEVIQALQGNRPEIVHIVDELARTLPDGVFYNSIERKGTVITLQGTAESNNRVSSLMRQLDASEWFTSPNLQVVQANRTFGDQANDFKMVVKLTSPSKVAKDDGQRNKKHK